MVPTTRRTTALAVKSKRKILKSPVRPDSSDSSSSSDNDDIPARINSSAHKQINGTRQIPTLRPQHSHKRLDGLKDDSPTLSRGPKRQKNGEPGRLSIDFTVRPGSRSGEYPTPSSPLVVQTVEVSEPRSASSSDDDQIIPGLINTINHTLKKPGVQHVQVLEIPKSPIPKPELPEESQNGDFEFPTPNQQLLSESLDDEIEEDQGAQEEFKKYMDGIGMGLDEDLPDKDLSVEPPRSIHEAVEQETDSEGGAMGSAAEQAQKIDDHSQESFTPTNMMRTGSQKGARSVTIETRNYSKGPLSSSPSPAKRPVDANRAECLSPRDPYEFVDSANSRSEYEPSFYEEEMELPEWKAIASAVRKITKVSQAISLDNDSDVDIEVLSDIDGVDNIMPITEVFNHEVRRFRARDVNYVDDSMFFDDPDPGQTVTIHLPPTPFDRVSGLMERAGWTGLQGDWTKEFLQRDIRTTVGKTMVHYLQKLERLCKMTPKAPLISEQSVFLREYDDLLRYCFAVIEGCIYFIREKRLCFPCESDIFGGNRTKRTELVKDLVRIIIPLCIHVLGKVWALGDPIDNDEPGTSFTSLAIQLLTRIVGWIGKLYAPLSRDLGTRSRSTSITQPEKDRADLGELLENLRKILGKAPERLRKEEHRLAEVDARRLWRLKKQEEIKATREADARTKEMEKREHNRKVVRSVRHVTSVSALHLAAASQAQPASWTKEEETGLFVKLQRSYPQLPNLADTAFSFGHSQEVIIEKTRKLLRKMFLALQPVMNDRDLEREVEHTLHQWG